jgi:hypothetical protein
LLRRWIVLLRRRIVMLISRVLLGRSLRDGATFLVGEQLSNHLY